MDILDNALGESVSSSSSDVGEKTFFNHVLRFDGKTKNELMDLFQYSVTAIFPILILNNIISNLFPEPDENKAILELVIEIGSELFLLLFGIYMIHRLVTYFPLFSGNAYSELNMLNIVLVFLIIILSFQTQLSEKANILFDHIKNYIFYNTGYDSSSAKRPQRENMDQKKDEGEKEETKDRLCVNPQRQVQNIQQSEVQANMNIGESPHSACNMLSSEPLAANEGFSGFSNF